MFADDVNSSRSREEPWGAAEAVDEGLGCFRSLGEIAAWVRLTPMEREAVMAALPARRQRYHIVGSHITISGT